MRNAAWLAVLGASASGCLPGDERPEPGSLLVTAEPNQATAEGFATPDGWTVTYDRFVTAVGQLRLSEDSCNDYGEARYAWLFDFTQAGREKVGLVYALGTCSVEFDFRPPSYNSPLGPGATEQDREFMRVVGTDAFAADQRIALIARGRAVRGGVTKRFEWLFRNRYELTHCPRESGDGFVSTVNLDGGEELTLRIIVRADELFRRAATDDAALHFDRFAGADADGDGNITLDELADVDAPPDDSAGELDAGSSSGDSAAAPPSLAALLYGPLLSRIMRVEGGGPCEAELEN